MFKSASNPHPLLTRLLILIIGSAGLWSPDLTYSNTATASRHPQDGPHADVRIFITDESITFNIMMNLVFIDDVAPSVRESPDALHPVEYDSVETAVTDYFRNKNRTTIDGIVVSPNMTSFEIMPGNVDQLPLFPVTGMRGLIAARMVIEYSVKSPPPQAISMVWGGYPPDTVLAEDPDNPPPLEIVAQLNAEGLLHMVTFTESEPENIWHATGTSAEERFLPVPEPAKVGYMRLPSLGLFAGASLVLLLITGLISRPWGIRRKSLLVLTILLLLISPLTVLWTSADANTPAFNGWSIRVRRPFDPSSNLPTDDEALDIFKPLHANIYRAFDFTDESDIYDALSRSVDGPLLDALYKQIYHSLIMQEEGGAVSTVKAVTPIENTIESIGTLPPNNTPSFEILTRWQVEGSVYHWGHTHTRLNEYEARYTVIGTDDGWRIASSKILEQFRVDSQPIPNMIEDTPPVDETPLDYEPGTDL